MFLGLGVSIPAICINNPKTRFILPGFDEFVSQVLMPEGEHQELNVTPETLDDTAIENAEATVIITLAPGRYSQEGEFPDFYIEGKTAVLIRGSQPARINGEINPNGSYVSGFTSWENDLIIFEDIIFDDTSPEYGGTGPDYAIYDSGTANVKVWKCAFVGDYLHDVSMKRREQRVEILFNYFEESRRHSIEVGQEVHYLSDPAQLGDCYIFGNHFKNNHLHAITQSSSGFTRIERNHFDNIPFGRSVQTLSLNTSAPHEDLLLLEGPLRTELIGNYFSGNFMGQTLIFSSRGVVDDTLYFKGNIALTVDDILLTTMYPEEAQDFVNAGNDLLTTAPPTVDPESDLHPTGELPLGYTPVIESTTYGTSDVYTSTHTVTLPSDLEVGDNVFVYMTIGGSDELVLPDGWTVLYETTNQLTALCLQRVIDGSEGETIEVISEYDRRSSWVAYRVSGAHGMIEIEWDRTQDHATEADVPELETRSVNNFLWLAAVHWRQGDRTLSLPSFFENLVEADPEFVGFSENLTAVSSYEKADNYLWPTGWGSDQVSDAGNNSVTSLMAIYPSETIFYANPNQAPVAVADTDNTYADTPLNIEAPGVLSNDTDADEDALTVVAVGGSEANVGEPVAGSNGGFFIINADGSWTFDPDGDFDELLISQEEETSVSYTVSDGKATDDATLTITVAGLVVPNTAPVAVADSANTDKATPINAAAPGVLANDTDADDDPLTVVAVGGDPNDVGEWVAGSNGGLFKINTNGSYEFDPNDEFEELGEEDYDTTSITYTVSDGEDTDDATLTITVFGLPPENTAPVAVNDSNSTGAGTVLNVSAPGVLANDTDVDLDSLTVVEVGGSSANVGEWTAGSNGGLFRINANGSYDFDPDGDFDSLNGTQSDTTSITYTVSDGEDTDSATLTITVSGVNKAPVATNDTNSTDEDTPLNISAPGVLSNDTDPESGSLSVTEVSGSPSNVGEWVAGSNGGLFKINANGSYEFDPNGEFEDLEDEQSDTTSVTYTVSDGSLTDTGTLTITVNGITPPAEPAWFDGGWPDGFTSEIDYPEENEISTAVYNTSTFSDTAIENAGAKCRLILEPGNYTNVGEYQDYYAEFKDFIHIVGEVAAWDDVNDQPNANGVHFHGLTSWENGTLVLENLIFDGTSDLYDSLGGADYAVYLHRESYVQIKNCVFAGEYIHDISFKRAQLIGEVLGNHFVTSKNHSIEIGQEIHYVEDETQVQKCVIKGNHFHENPANTITNQSSKLVIVDGNIFDNVNRPFRTLPLNATPNSNRTLKLLDEPLRVEITNNTFINPNLKLWFEGRGRDDDTVYFHGNTGITADDIDLTEMDPADAALYAADGATVETLDPPTVDPESDLIPGNGGGGDPGGDEAAPEVISSAVTNNDDWYYDHVVNLPGNLTIGDRLFVFFTGGGEDTYSKPAGWDVVYEEVHQLTGICLTRVVDGSEGATITLSLDTEVLDQASTAVAVSVRGVDDFEADTWLQNNPTTAGVATFKAANGVRNYLWLSAVHWRRGTRTVNPPAGYTLIAQQDDGYNSGDDMHTAVAYIISETDELGAADWTSNQVSASGNHIISGLIAANGPEE